MTALGQIAAGGRILASAVQGVAPLAVIKGVDETITSSTTMQNDDALFVSVAANATYLFDCYLNWEGGTQGSSDIKWQWSGPSGFTLRYGASYASTAGVATVNATYGAATVVTAGSNGAGVLRMVIMQGTLVTSGTAGTLQLQWAQNTSSGTGTIVHAQSRLALWRIS